MAEVGKSLGNSPEERLAKYRLFASQARASAEEAKTPEARQTYLAMASAWELLIEELVRGATALNPDSTLPLGNSLGRGGQIRHHE